ncbi:DUF3800 domain-containing protein [Acinetobacter lwoffii]|uniref:DUF3800 domain-containing protein n=1 Tax=Acinetobacter lwoffii TaxID=28090 RepID=UPI00209A82B5|nr:DUF3800 domain-containing protein [Acinetobacter lwoffii]MCO8098391.1 DUF3800 domain-containing protein [Acinetobacter lwoffii]
MYIFIDESGLFRPTDNNRACSTIGALCVPDESMEKVENALNDLKKALDIESENEIKNPRPDCSSQPFELFITELKSLNCSFEALVTNISIDESETIIQRKNLIIKGIEKYIEKEKLVGEELNHSMEVKSLLEKLSLQLFQQVYMQCHLLVGLIEKAVNFYAKLSPQSLSSFQWRLDQKGIEANARNFEKVFESLYLTIAVSSTLRSPMRFVFEEGSDFNYLLKSFCAKKCDEKLENDAKLYEIDVSTLKDYMHSIQLGSILAEDFKFTDSKTSHGLQIVDLLVSSTNRCLKRNFTDNEKMARLLGGLMINSPDYEKYAIRTVRFDGSISHAKGAEDTIKLYKLMDQSSNKVFTEQFKKNLFINMQKLKAHN